ncbi:MAG: enoyl-CoA hydratase-related protein [Myxococcales bacterium]|nr:enoyl-CoA hydratase-related protein [Myxococcota bacterium]MDW8281154.1 enoyl-CoA hydratase-related protein [Myxococcales bacterium]
MSFETILLQTDGPVLTLTINRPRQLNALNSQVLTELSQALREVDARPEVRAVILTGAGDRAFVAGADIAEMAGFSPSEALEFAGRGHRLMDQIAQLPQPVLAAVNGFALGGGTELALACDLIYASQKARFGQPEVTLGVMPGFGGTQRLPRLIGPARAAEMILGGEQISAEEALRMGLVLAVLPPDELLPHCRQVAARIASRAPLAVRAAKRALRQVQEQPLAAGCALEQRLFSELFSTADQREGMAAFLAKRPAQFVGK